MVEKNEFGDQPVAELEVKQGPVVDVEPIVKHSEVKDPEDLTPEQIEAAQHLIPNKTPDQIEAEQHLIQDKNKQESTVKASVVEDYKSAQQEWDYYKKAKDFLMENKQSPEQLKVEQKKVTEELGRIDLQITKSNEAQEKSKNFLGKIKRLFSSETPVILSEEKRKEAENKTEELKKQIADLKDKIVETTEAKNFINTHDELKLRNRAEETKLEAEKR